MEEKIIALKMKSRTASKEELAAIDKEMENLAIENPKAFSNALRETLKKTLVEIEELNKSKSRIF